MILLSNRSLVKLSGDDARKFLQGLITNDVEKLNSEKALYAALQTPQGKYLFDFFLYEIESAIFIDVAKDRAAELIKKLSMYKLRSKVVIEDVSVEYKVYYNPLIGLIDPRTPKLGRRLVKKDELPENGNLQNYEHLRLQLGVPDSVDLIPEKSFIIQNSFEALNAIDYQKGCYIGQEIIARVKFKSAPNKKLYRVIGESDLPEFGIDIKDGERSVGELRSSLNNIGIAQCAVDVDLEKDFFAGNVKIKLAELDL